MDLHYCRETLLSTRLAAMLQFRHVYPGSRIWILSIPDLESKGSPDPHPHQRIWVFLLKYFFPSPLTSRIRILFFYPSRIPVPGVKRDRIPDPESGSATLLGFTHSETTPVECRIRYRYVSTVQAAGEFAVLMVNCRSMLKLFFCPHLCSPLFMTLRCAALYTLFEGSIRAIKVEDSVS